MVNDDPNATASVPEDWGDRFDTLVRSIQDRMPAGITLEEIEVDITAAREGVRRNGNPGRGGSSTLTKSRTEPQDDHAASAAQGRSKSPT